MERVTNTDKWKDAWFMGLTPFGKLTFIFLYENCNEAGFYDLNSTFMANQLKFDKAYWVVRSINEIKKAFVFNENGKRVWMKNFLRYQNQLPLESDNPDHQKIIMLLERNLEDFEDHPEIRFILDRVDSGVGVSNKKTTRSRFKKPSLEEFKDYGRKYAEEKQWHYTDTWAEELYDHYETRNWIPKGYTKQMTDWKSAVRNSLRRNNTPKDAKNGKGKVDKLKQTHDNLAQRDWSQMGG